MVFKKNSFYILVPGGTIGVVSRILAQDGGSGFRVQYCGVGADRNGG